MNSGTHIQMPIEHNSTTIAAPSSDQYWEENVKYERKY